jgi:hypothetical protein
LRTRPKVYKLWVRLKADSNSWSNDSIWIQFSGAADAAGTPKYQIGTTSGLAVNLEECSNCGLSGWGWEDDGWGALNKAAQHGTATARGRKPRIRVRISARSMAGS